MSKAQYLLLAAFIGFYGLLFTLLMVRVLASLVMARVRSIRPAARIESGRAKTKRPRPWTDTVWRNA
jgi:HAMP domain-containing protein